MQKGSTEPNQVTLSWRAPTHQADARTTSELWLVLMVRYGELFPLKQVRNRVGYLSAVVPNINCILIKTQLTTQYLVVETRADTSDPADGLQINTSDINLQEL